MHIQDTTDASLLDKQNVMKDFSTSLLLAELMTESNELYF